MESINLKDFFFEFSITGLPAEWFGDVTDKKAVTKTTIDIFSELDILELRKLASTSTLCPLCQTKHAMVFGDGNTNSPLIVFVAEGADADDGEQWQPFVGKAGKLLTDAIEKGLGMKPKDVYVCSVVKCRPSENRTSLANEVQSGSEYLYRQLELINPKVIVTLGEVALSARNIGITELRGQWQKWHGIPLMPTYHPSYILRNPPAKKPFWEDLQEVMKFLGI